MTITTSKGKTFDVEWAWAPNLAGNLAVEYTDGRSFQEILSDWEGCEHFHRESKSEGDMDYDGYVRVVTLMRLPNGNVALHLAKATGGETAT